MRRVERFADFPTATEKKSVFFVVKVAASRHGSACVTADGALFCWGSNRRGALGLGDDMDRDVPTRVRVCASSGDDETSDGETSDETSDDETSASGSDFSDFASDDERDGGAPGSPGRFSSPFASSALAARRFPGALSDTDSTDSTDSNSDAEVPGRKVSRGEAKGKAPASRSGARARDGAPNRRRVRTKKKNETRRRRDCVFVRRAARRGGDVARRVVLLGR